MRVRFAIACGAFLSVLWGFQTLLLAHAPSVFSDPREDMSFGWYVPVFSLYVLWTERKKLLESLGAPSWAGFAAMLFFLAVGFLGVRGIQVRLEIVAFAGLMVALPWALFGRAAAARMLFPAAFLLFCVPLATFLDVVTVHLRIFASSSAYAVLKGFGVEVVRQGTMISALDGSFAIDVAEPCSGLRSIFALMALTAGYAYMTQRTWIKRAILFATSVPLAVLGNIARILSICLVASVASPDFATGFYHDYSGYVVFAVAIMLMVAVGSWLARIKVPSSPRTLQPAPGTSRKAPRTSNLIIPASVLAVLVPAMIYQATAPQPHVAEAPEVALCELPGFTSQKLETSEAEQTVLPPDTKLDKRLYSDANGELFQVTLVIGGTSKSSIHRPELCLPAQGCLMTNPRTRTVLGRDWRFISVELPNKAHPMGFAYTFFNQQGFSTASHTSRIFRDVVDRSIFNQIDRWVMCTINSSRADDAALAAFAAVVEKEVLGK